MVMEPVILVAVVCPVVSVGFLFLIIAERLLESLLSMIIGRNIFFLGRDLLVLDFIHIAGCWSSRIYCFLQRAVHCIEGAVPTEVLAVGRTDGCLHVGKVKEAEWQLDVICKSATFVINEEIILVSGEYLPDVGLLEGLLVDRNTGRGVTKQFWVHEVGDRVSFIHNQVTHVKQSLVH